MFYFARRLIKLNKTEQNGLGEGRDLSLGVARSGDFIMETRRHEWAENEGSSRVEGQSSC